MPDDTTTTTTTTADTTKAADTTTKTADTTTKAADTTTTTTQADKSWRDFITDDGLKEHAKNFTDVNHLLRGHADLRKKLSSAIVPPGKDAKPEEVDAFRVKIGVPVTVDGYKFDVPEGYQQTDADKAFQKQWAEDFHKLNVPAETALALSKAWNARAAAAIAGQVEADKKFVADSEAALKEVWRGDYETNKKYAAEAAAKGFGRNLDAAQKLETKDGRFVLDHPLIVEMLAAIGREMTEPSLRINAMSESDRGTLQDQFDELSSKLHDARMRNDHIAVRQLDAKRTAIADKLFPGTNAPPGAAAA